MSRRRVAALIGAAVLVGAAAGLLFGLAWVRYTADPAPQQQPWPVTYRCGIVLQPEDLDRADHCCACDR
jgi:hypothetical protein